MSDEPSPPEPDLPQESLAPEPPDDPGETEALDPTQGSPGESSASAPTSERGPGATNRWTNPMTIDLTKTQGNRVIVRSDLRHKLATTDPRDL